MKALKVVPGNSLVDCRYLFFLRFIQKYFATLGLGSVLPEVRILQLKLVSHLDVPLEVRIKG